MKDVNLELLRSRLKRLNLFVEKVPHLQEIGCAEAWLVLQACAGGNKDAWGWLFRKTITDIRIGFFVWWNYTVMKRDPEDMKNI